MKIKKESSSFNTYKAEFNANELRILYSCLMANPGQGPDAEEMQKGLQYYFDRLPAPGEDTSPGKSSNAPNPGADAAKDALSPMELDEPPEGEFGNPDDEFGDPGQPKTLSQTISQDGNEFVDPSAQPAGGDVSFDDYELPEPPSES